MKILFAVLAIVFMMAVISAADVCSDGTDEETPGGKCVANVTQNVTQNQTHTNTTQNQTTHTNTTQNQTGAGTNTTGNQTGQQTSTNQTPSGQGYTTPVDKYRYEDITPKEKIGGLCLFTVFIPLFVVGIALARNR